MPPGHCPRRSLPQFQETSFMERRSHSVHQAAKPRLKSCCGGAVNIMKVFLLLLLGLFLLIVPLGTQAQLREGKTTIATPTIEELRAKGSEALLSLDYEAARQAFKAIARTSPADPTGPPLI